MDKRVVLVDDNPLILESLQETVDWASLNCRVAGSFTNGQEGLAFCRAQRPDLIITDIKMPGLTGLELIEALQREYTSFQAIIITGFDEFSFAQKALRLGAADIILKPIENAVLLEAVRRALGSAPQAPGGSAPKEAPPPAAPLPFSPVDEGKRYTASVHRALNYMKEHLDAKISLPELADYVGLSSAHLSRLLKKETGKNFVDINNEMRVEKAIRLLAGGQYKVYEVSSMVGIENYAYFYQLFKKLTGKSPKDYM